RGPRLRRRASGTRPRASAYDRVTGEASMAAISTLPIRSMRSRVSAEEWELRIDLAACYRLLARYGMTDLVYNHVTARVPGPEHHILINAYGMLYEEITASSLIKVDLAGNIVDKSDHGYSVNAAGYHPQRDPRGAARRAMHHPHAHPG